MSDEWGMKTSRRNALSLIALGAISGCVDAIGDREAQLREEWEESDEVPDREEVNRQDDFNIATTLDQVSSFRPATAPLLGGIGPRTNRHYEITAEMDEDVNVFVLDEYDPDDGVALVEYLDQDFSYIPDYSEQTTTSYSAYVYVPDDEIYTLAIDYPDVSPERRHLEDPIPIDVSVEGYYYLPFDVYKERRTDG